MPDDTTSIDEKDLRILYAAAEEKSLSPDRLATATGIPKSTVHYRLQQLRSKEVLLNDFGEVALDRLGLEMQVISEVWANYTTGYHDAVGSQIAEIECVNQVYFTMGDTDFVVIANLASRDMIEQLIAEYEAIDAIDRTSSKFVIKSLKRNGHPLTDFDIETLLALL